MLNNENRRKICENLPNPRSHYVLRARKFNSPIPKFTLEEV